MAYTSEEAGREAASTATAPNQQPTEEVDVAPSKRTTSPAFQWYPKEFLSSSKVIAMTAAERGAYITLLSTQWLDGSLPNDLPVLARLAGIPTKQFIRIWPLNLGRCFTVKGGRLVNGRLERERQKQVEYRERQALHGAKGGRPADKGFVKATVSEPLSETKGSERFPVSDLHLQSASAFPKKNVHAPVKAAVVAESDPPCDVWLRELQAAYPPSAVSSGHLTEVAFLDAVRQFGTPDITFTVIMANLENQKSGHQWRVKGMIPRLDRWLREGLWQQTHEAAPVSQLVSERTARTLLSGAAFVAGGGE